MHHWIDLRPATILTILAGVLCATVATTVLAKDLDRGRGAFERRCAGCHALDKSKVGPPLRSIYGRNAGKEPRFAYSDAMKNASVVWDEATLDRWLTETENVIPGNDMASRLNDPADRADIIAYLKRLSGK